LCTIPWAAYLGVVGHPIHLDASVEWRMTTTNMHKVFRYIAIAGNVIYVLWILANGINEGFKGTIVEIVSYIGLLLLLTLNTVLLFPEQKPVN
jgi:hypothetical protein